MNSPLKHIQFSLANALRATGWLCLSAGSFSFVASQPHHRSFPWPQGITSLLALVFTFLMIWSPIVAVGALFGKTKQGMVVGIQVVVLLLLVGWMFLPTVH